MDNLAIFMDSPTRKPAPVAEKTRVALRFLLRRPSLFAIPKAGRIPHVEDNAAAGALALSATELARIDAAFPRGRQRRGVPML